MSVNYLVVKKFISAAGNECWLYSLPDSKSVQKKLDKIVEGGTMEQVEIIPINKGVNDANKS